MYSILRPIAVISCLVLAINTDRAMGESQANDSMSMQQARAALIAAEHRLSSLATLLRPSAEAGLATINERIGKLEIAEEHRALVAKVVTDQFALWTAQDEQIIVAYAANENQPVEKSIVVGQIKKMTEVSDANEKKLYDTLDELLTPSGSLSLLKMMVDSNRIEFFGTPSFAKILGLQPAQTKRIEELLRSIERQQKALHLEAAPSQEETLKRIRAVQAQAGEYAVRMLGVLNDEQLERVLRFKDASKSAEEQIAALPDHLKKVFESERPLK